MDKDQLRQRFEESPFNRNLGLRVEALESDGLRLRVPYRDEIANPGGALHGGVMAALIDNAGALVALAGGSEGSDAGTLDLSVNYLAAALNEDIVASAEALRRGKEITYTSVDVRNDAGKRIAFGTSTYRIFNPATVAQYAERQHHGSAPAAPHNPQTIRGADMFVGLGFIARLGMTVSHAFGGAALLHMPAAADIADTSGAIHEGAIAALIDTTGALASWSVVGLNMRNKASTVGIHVNYHASAKDEPLDAWALTQRRNNEIFLNQVTVSGRDSRRVVATGTVTYRIVVADKRE